MKAYSLDLRQKIVDAYASGDISQRKLAKNFGVTLSFVQNLLKRDGYARRRHHELGTIGPKVRTEQTPTKLNAEQLEILRQLVTAQPDATLSELRERLYLRENRGLNWGGHGESDGSLSTSPQPQDRESLNQLSKEVTSRAVSFVAWSKSPLQNLRCDCCQALKPTEFVSSII